MNESPQRIGAFSLLSNISFAAVKIIVGSVGASYALIADGIESLADCLSSVIVWKGLRVGSLDADHDHPYGHGKAEAVAALLAGVGLLISAAIIAYNAIKEIITPHGHPAFFTIPALIGVILAKEFLYQLISHSAETHDSQALRAEAWHHRSDALTSLGVLLGIALAVFAGPRFLVADEIAACLVTCLIVFNAIRIMRPALDELMDTRIEDENHREILETIRRIEGVLKVETLIVRRSGRDYLVDVHLEVNPAISVAAGHQIAHFVKDALLQLPAPRVTHVATHVEPHPTDQPGQGPRPPDPGPRR